VPAVTFYFDLGSPYAYLTAERLDTVLAGAPVRWQPVLLGGLFKLTGRSSWARGEERGRREGMEEVQRRAESNGLPPIRWPDPWPGDGLLAMRAVTFAFMRSDRNGRELAMAAFRAAFQDGIDLSVEAEVLAAAARAGLRQEDVRQAVRDPQIKQALRDATQAAHATGVFGVPTVAVDGELFWGDDRLEEAATAAGSNGAA